jgi:diketogulonate reductase-like aldo/keto reductase
MTMTASGYTPWQERALWDGLVKMYKVHILKCTLYIVTFLLTKTRALTFEIFFKEGYVSAVGVSNYGPKTLRKVHAYLRYGSISRSHYLSRSLLILY